MPAQIKCIVCRGTGIYFNATNFGKNPEPCRYCEGTGKTEVQQRTKPRSYIVAGPGFIIAEGVIEARETHPSIDGHPDLTWAVIWAAALDKERTIR